MDIKLAFENFKNTPFPDNSASSDNLSEIYDELVAYDAYIAGQIDQVVSGRKSIKLKYDLKLEQRINSFLKKQDRGNPDGILANDFLNYLRKIKELIELADIHQQQS